MTRRAEYLESNFCHRADDLLGEFGTADRRELRNLKKRVQLKPGDFLVKAGDKPQRIYVHRFGNIRTTLALGAESCITGEETELVYGVTETLSGQVFEYSIEAISPTEFDVIEKEDFLHFIRSRPELIQRLSLGLSKMYSQAVKRLRGQ